MGEGRGSLYLLRDRVVKVGNRFGKEVFVSLLAVKRIIALDADNFAIGVGVYRYSRWMEIYPVSSTDRVSLIRKFLYLPRKRLVI